MPMAGLREESSFLGSGRWFSSSTRGVGWAFWRRQWRIKRATAARIATPATATPAPMAAAALVLRDPCEEDSLFETSNLGLDVESGVDVDVDMDVEF